MRTTLSLDDDVLFAIKERARRENRTMGELLSELARQALTHTPPPRDANETREVHGFKPLASRGATVSNELIDRLREEDSE